MTKPICWAMWSSRFCTKARVTGSSIACSKVENVVGRAINFEHIQGPDHNGCCLLIDNQWPVQPVVGLEQRPLENGDVQPSVVFIDINGTNFLGAWRFAPN